MKTLLVLLVLPFMSIAQSTNNDGKHLAHNKVNTSISNTSNKLLFLYHAGGEDAIYNLKIHLANDEVLTINSVKGNPLSIADVSAKNIAKIEVFNIVNGTTEVIEDLEKYLKSPVKLTLEDHSTSRRSNCGTGNIPYTNCDNENIQVPRENIVAETFVHVDDDYITCIAYVDSNCHIETSFRTFCTYYPGESAGDYDLGLIHYDKVMGIEEYTNQTGIQCSDRQGEEINFVLCNAYDLGYNNIDMNAAIWGILNQRPCNALCNKAKLGVVNPTGKISPNLEFYIPINNDSVQPQVRNKCFRMEVDPLYFPCGSNREIDTYVRGILHNSSSQRFIDIPNPGNVVGVMAELWVEPGECTGGIAPTAITVEGRSGASIQIEDAFGTSIIQTSSSTTIEKVYRHYFDGSFDRISVEHSFANCDISSMAIYVVREVVGSSGALSTSINREFHFSNYASTIDIGPSPVPRDIKVKVPIHEIGNSGRIARIEAWYDGGPVAFNEVNMATEGLEGALLELNVPNVPADKDFLNIKIISPNTNGESFGVGSVAITTNASCCVTDYSEFNISICEDENYQLPDGSIVNTSGSYTTNLISSDLCDSIVTVNLEVYQNFSTDVLYEFCDGDSVLLPNRTYFHSSGIFAFPFLTSHGCDSIINVEVIVHPVTNELEEIVLCEGESHVLPDGQIVTDTGTYISTLSTVFGCEYTVTAEVKVNPTYIRTEFVSICNGESHQLPNGLNVNEAGVYVSNLSSIHSCDSIIETTIAIKPQHQLDLTYEVCDGESVLLPDGSLVTTSGNHQFTFTSSQGCDSIINVEVIVHANEEISEAISLCEGEQYELIDGQVVNQAGTYIKTTTTAYGCEKNITTVVTVNSMHSSVIYASICIGELYQLPDGNWVSESGNYISNLVSVHGCDSIVETQLEVNANYISELKYELCDGESVLLPDGSQISTSANLVFNFVSNQGCDSIINIDVLVYESDDSIQDIFLCLGEQYELPNGEVTGEQGSYQDTFTNEYGCEYVITTNIIVQNNIDSTIQEVVICEGEEYILPDGQMISDEGQYISVLNNSMGCDSVIQTIVSVNSSYLLNFNEQICFGETFELPNGQEVSESGEYIIDLLTKHGCDSILIFQISILLNDDTTVNVQICEGESYVLASGELVSVSGVYIVQQSNDDNCSAKITTNLSVLPSYDAEYNIELCEGDSYFLPNGQLAFESGEYTFNLLTEMGCDSIVTFNIHVYETHFMALTEYICPGDTAILPNGVQVFQESVVDVNFQTTHGCDSVIQYSIIELNNESIREEITICVGNQYQLGNGEWVSRPGIYTYNIEHPNGCTVEVITEIIEQNSYLIQDTFTICEGEEYVLPNGEIVTSSGSYTATEVSSFGCDSTVVIVLEVIPKTFFEEVVICQGSSYMTSNGIEVNESGVLRDTFVNVHGCLGINVTNIVVEEAIPYDVSMVLCEGEVFELSSGEMITAPGIYIDTLTSVNDCDSLVRISLNVEPNKNSERDVELCPGDFYVLPDGEVVYEAQTYSTIIDARNGCDSVITTRIRLRNAHRREVRQSICPGDFYELPNGERIENDTVVEFSFPSATVCDSTVLYAINFRTPQHIQVDTTVCDDFPLAIGHGIYWEQGFHRDTFVNSNGCDSLVGVLIRLHEPFVKYIDTTLCPQENLYIFGKAIAETGTYHFNFIDRFGCDSVYIVSLEHFNQPEISARGDTTIRKGSVVRSFAVHERGNQLKYQWYVNDELTHSDVKEFQRVYYSDALVKVVVIDENLCEAKDEHRIRVETNCPESLVSAANIISPNGDGANDFFQIRTTHEVQIELVEIYNRWGEVVFRSHDLANLWDGTFRGEACNPDVYTYYTRAYCSPGNGFTKYGNVTLIK